MWLANGVLPNSNIWAASEQQIAIVRSWQGALPAANPDRNAVTWIGWPLSNGFEMALDKQRYVVTATGHAPGFLLANVPLILFLASSRAPARKPLLAIGQAGAVLAMGATFLMGADWGTVYLPFQHPRLRVLRAH